MSAEENKAIYREWVKEREDAISLFFQDWWLDAVSDSGAWHCCIATDDDRKKVLGVMPYYLSRRWGVLWNNLPPLTPFLGPLLEYPDGMKRPQRYAFEKRVYTQLIEQLPSTFLTATKFHYEFTNWLPFYWEGFQQRVHYSYVIEPLREPAELYSRFKGAVRTQIRKTEQQYTVELSEDWPTLYQLNLRVFERQSLEAPFSKKWLAQLDEALSARHRRRIYLAREPANGTVVAALYTVHDAQSAYLLLTSRLENAQPSAVPLLIWRAIQDYSADGLARFDFEGSMLPGVERFFRSFGGELKPYFRITNRRYQLLELLRQWIR